MAIHLGFNDNDDDDDDDDDDDYDNDDDGDDVDGDDSYQLLPLWKYVCYFHTEHRQCYRLIHPSAIQIIVKYWWILRDVIAHLYLNSGEV